MSDMPERVYVPVSCKNGRMTAWEYPATKTGGHRRQEYIRADLASPAPTPLVIGGDAILALASLKPAAAEPAPNEEEIEAVITTVWLETKPRPEAQKIRSEIKLDTGKYGQAEADYLPGYVWDIADIAAQRAFDTAKPGITREALEALQFYGDKDTYVKTCWKEENCWWAPIDDDGGERARFVLALETMDSGEER